VVNPGIRPAKADVYMHFDEAEKVISRRTVVPLKNEMNIVLVEVKSSKLQKEAMKEVQSVIPDLVISSYACWKPAATVMGMNEKSVWLLAILLCLATVSLALRSQWASVIERRRDIGIMKAIGWTNRVVVEQILTESMLQALIGGVAGCIIALLILLLIPAQYILGGTESMVVALSPLVFVSGLALSLLGGAIAGILPARYAANQSPADALRQL
jgi:putative ABC transport system permease protein